MNKNLKRIAALLLAIAMVASFAACKNDKNNNDTTAAGDIAINGDAIADDLLPEAPRKQPPTRPQPRPR